MKKFIVLSLMAICSFAAMAQDNYAEAVKSYFTTYSENTDFAGVPQEMMSQLLDIYVEECKANGVTLEDIDEMSKLMSSEAGQTYLAHNAKIQGEEAQEKIQELLMSSMMPIFMGGEAKDVPTPEVSDSYKAKFHELYENAQMGAMFDAIFTMMGGMMQNQPDGEQTMKKLSDFIVGQGENIVITLANGNLTEEDLDFGNATYKRPAAKRLLNATTSSTKKFLQNLMSQMQQ